MNNTSPSPGTMTARERLEAAYRGDPVDRVPLWFREGFPFLGEPANADDFRNGWQADPLYRELFDLLKPHAALYAGWGIGGQNRFLMVPPEVMESTTEEVSPDIKRRHTVIHTPKGDLTAIGEIHRNEATSWRIKHPVETLDDLLKLRDVPYSFDETRIDRAIEAYENATAQVGDRGVVETWFSSPMVCISGAMPLQLFLELTVTERELIHELCEDITQRILFMLDKLFERGIRFRSVANMGGSEQCTPPMTRPEGYDEFVVPYDGRIVERCRREGIPFKIHCHGKIRHALKCMREMGVDATDPVEPPPAGDVTYAEAREIAGDDVTLVGNLQFDELEFAEPQHIRERVKEILSHGNRRLILGASAGPITRVTPKLVENYRAWLETALEYGQ